MRPHPWDSPGRNTGVGCHFLLQCIKVKSESEVAQSCLTLLDSMDCSLPGSSVHGIFQARVLEWGAMPSPKGRSPGLLFPQLLFVWKSLFFFNIYCCLFIFNVYSFIWLCWIFAVGYGILVPRSGIEPEFPALEGRFLTTGPSGKSLKESIFLSFLKDNFDFFFLNPSP